MPFGLGLPEVAILLLVGVLLFGKKIPQIAFNIGKGITEFKKGVNGLENEANSRATISK